ncbi:MAG: NAD(P)-binding domain-containing protein, partial [Chloroflexi bacterium]|nr:NAD(P)-binding domain-containing protein [Chloroflexota bacterium]
MFSGTRVAFIGSGAMAEAMMSGMLAQQLIEPQDIVAAGPREERGAALRDKYAITATTDNLSAIEGAGVVVLSVKPQVLPVVMQELNGRLVPEMLALSIIAGARMETIIKGLHHFAVVRSMPNTP